MRIITNKGQYDLPENFVLEMERKNPFFSKIGEKSIPVTLPLTKNNLRIIGYSNISSNTKPISSLDVFIEDGMTRLTAKQIIHKTTKEGISTTFYPNIGAFWTTIKDKKLKDVMSGFSYASTSLMTDLQNSMKSTANFDFIVFPVACKNGGDKYFILNQTENTDSEGTTYLVGRKARIIQEGDKNTTVPIGYGITPFLRLHIVLEKVISFFGYTLEGNFLASGEFSTLCILNNCADPVVINRIDYSQLVPNITIQDFLNVIRFKFCCEFISDESRKTINISFLKDQLSQSPNTDLSSIRVSELDYEPPTFSQITISQDTSLENAAPETETLEKFVEKYKTIGAVSENEFFDQAIISKYNAVLRLAEGRFYSIEFDGINTRKEAVGTVFFNYNKGGDVTNEEIQLKDTAVPIIPAGKNETLMPFVGNIWHQNTAIKEKSGETKEEKKDSSKFAMLCFAKYKTVNSLQTCYGTPFNYDDQGHRDGNFSLQSWGADGIFHRFYKLADSFYRHSNVTINVEMLLTENLKSNLSEIKPVLVDNQILLPDTISYTIGRKVQKKCVFRTVKLYEPHDIQQEQSIPEIIYNHTIAVYFWKYNDNSSSIIPPSSGLDDYGYRLNGEIYKPIIAPTEQQYIEYQQGTVFFASQVSVIIEHYVMGTLTDQIPSTLEYWYTIEKK